MPQEKKKIETIADFAFDRMKNNYRAELLKKNDKKDSTDIDLEVEEYFKDKQYLKYIW